MSGLEVLAVVSAVAALVSAFHDGSRIVNELRERREARRGPPPTKFLQEALDRGPPAIEEAKRVGLDRFGDQFGVGDHITIISLQTQVIQLQQSVTNHLRPATMDDTFVDFEALVRAADISKMNAVRALQDLYMRMDAVESSTSHAIMHLPSPPVTPGPKWEFSSSLPQRPSPPASALAPPDPALRKSFTSFLGPGQSQHPPSPSPSTGERHLSPVPPPRTETRMSETPSFNSSSRQTTLVEDPCPEIGPRRASDSKPARRSSFFGLLKRRSYQSETCSTLPEETKYIPNRASISTDPSSVSVQASQLRHNGYCKGAYLLQVGLKKESMKLRNQPSGITGQSYYWACCSSKCCFEGPAVQAGKSWDFEEQVWTSSGVRFRWSFLAKSHVPTKKTKGKLFDYKCIFCEAHKKSSDVYKGIREFMAHIVEHNREDWDASSVQNMKFITGREADVDEIFDINFTTPRRPIPPAAEGGNVEDGMVSRSDNPPVWDLGEEAVFGGGDVWR